MVDKIIRKLFEHDEHLDRIERMMATKDALREVESRIMTVLDQQTVILQRLDQERHFTGNRVDRLDDRVRSLKFIPA